MEELVKSLRCVSLNNSYDFVKEVVDLDYRRYSSKYKKNDFRQISIYPSITELVSGEKLRIKHNIINGPYTDVYDYLDTHFRLLREDFVNPIREDICSYILNPTKSYSNIKFHVIIFLRKGVKRDKECFCLEIKKSIGNACNIIKNQKAFMVGSLLLFTDDNFKTIFCGKVEDAKNLNYKKMLVSFENNVQLTYDKEYLMVECNIFFEPYYQVLKVLQEMPQNDFPMERYIINVDVSVQLPNYLKRIRPAVLDQTLNKSQTRALKSALSQELAIVQGPPGTGKTFLGLKLAKTLLVDYKKWWHNSPMLIISLTNHALDQFLEGLLDTTKNLLRLGGQSKSVLLIDYTIPKMREKLYNRQSSRSIASHYRELCHIERKITSVGNQLDNINTNNRTCIFSFSVLSSAVSEMQCWYSSNIQEEFACWLLEDDGTIISNNEVPYLIEDGKSQDARVLIKLWKLCFGNVCRGSSYCFLSTSIMTNAAAKFKKYIDNSNLNDTTEAFCELKSGELREYYEYLIKKIDYLKLCLNTTFDEVEAESVDLKNPFIIPVKTRWQLYNSWLRTYQTKLMKDMDILINKYMPIYKTFNEHSTNNTLELMQQMKVIGMTTTCAARMRSTIEALKCPIVIVEEAAEVLEAHITAALTKHCEHLILIGDHKQLKPATSDYKIEVEYKLGISLFERMVINNFQCHVLNVQHRMRPEISSLISPTIYPELIDHDSVKKFPNIQGMEKNVFFIDHTKEEQGAGESSKKNLYEVEFLIQLAIYLINNNYSPKDITILAAYLGQKAALIQEQNNCQHSLIKQVRIDSVDNFQGEENKIILLSLVRNNPDKRIGFLSIENRVCVALSRAKMGLYIMGNMTQLVTASKLWRSINKSLKSQNGIGPNLVLRCQNHKIPTSIKDLDDFKKVSDGGCFLPCKFVLTCGHICTKHCHVTDEDHKEFQCLQPCTRSLCENDVHKCKQQCFMECGQCNYPVNSYLSCGHQKRCYMSKMEDYVCYKCIQ